MCLWYGGGKRLVPKKKHLPSRLLFGLWIKEKQPYRYRWNWWRWWWWWWMMSHLVYSQRFKRLYFVVKTVIQTLCLSFRLSFLNSLCNHKTIQPSPQPPPLHIISQSFLPKGETLDLIYGVQPVHKCLHFFSNGLFHSVMVFVYARLEFFRFR